MLPSHSHRPGDRARLLLALLAILVLAGQACAYWPNNPPTLPAKGGKFTDPTWGTTILRVTDATDGNGWGTAYSYWPTFNRDNTRILIFNTNDGTQYVQQFDPTSFALVGSRTVLFATSPPSGGMPRQEDVIWSGLNATHLFSHGGLYLWDYDVASNQWTLVKDFTGAGLPAGAAHLDQHSRSPNDDVFGFSVKNSSWSLVGYGAWKRSTNQLLLSVANTSFDEVQVDKSGRYLVAKMNDGTVIVYDLQQGTNTTLTDGAPDYAPGHSDNGQSTCLGHDNWLNRYLLRNLATPHNYSVVYDWGSNWGHAEHMSFLADDEGWLALSTYEMNGSPPPDNNLRSEIFRMKTDGSGQVQHLCHHYSDFNSGDYWQSPRANISRDGRYIAFTSEYANSGQQDLFIVQVPSAAPQPPVANFTGNPTAGPAPLTVYFTDTSTNLPTSWSWTFGDGGTSAAQHPSHQYQDAGSYTVSLTATNAAGSDVETKANYVTATAPQGGLLSDGFETALNWTQSGDVTWYTGSPKLGTHSVRLRRTGSIVKTISTVGYQDIAVSFYLGANSLDNANEYVEAHWYDGSVWTLLKRISNGDPEEDNQLHFFSYALPAGASNNPNFALRFRIVASGTADYGYVDEVVVTGVPIAGQAPVANFTALPTSGAAPLAVQFTDTSTNTPTSWSWNFGDSGTAATQNPSHTYTSAGSYTVSLTATNAYGSDSEVKTGYISVTGATEVYVYPDAWNWHSNGVGTLIAGGLSDVQSSNDGYMQVRCNTSNHNSGLRFEFHTGYTPAQVSKITVEYEFHCSRSDQPYFQCLILKQDGSSGNTGMGGGLWTTSDQWLTWETTAISTYMSASGYLHVTMCGCSQNSNDYDTYADVVRVKLTLK